MFLPLVLFRARLKSNNYDLCELLSKNQSVMGRGGGERRRRGGGSMLRLSETNVKGGDSKRGGPVA